MEYSMDATPIPLLVQLANQYSSCIYFEMENAKVNAKSIMGMMNLMLSTGNEVTLNVEGDDESEAIEALERFLTE
jgi:catabolite repression HPr-like protein